MAALLLLYWGPPEWYGYIAPKARRGRDGLFSHEKKPSKTVRSSVSLKIQRKVGASVVIAWPKGGVPWPALKRVERPYDPLRLCATCDERNAPIVLFIHIPPHLVNGIGWRHHVLKTVGARTRVRTCRRSARTATACARPDTDSGSACRSCPRSGSS